MVGMEDFFNQGRRVKNATPVEPEKTNPPQAKVKNEEKQEDVVFRSSGPVEEPSRVRRTSKAQKELEDRKRYPERTFDKYVQKGARLRSDDLDLLRVFCSEITRAKREMPYEYRVNKRITDNTILRVLVHSFCEKVEEQLDHIDFKGIQSEEELRNFIEQTMKF